ncbi:MAG: hypothetical protein LBU51_01805, partial [Bacteroidales bacterium]|nr:hypothetical protein [Bacteroidales bacterium]
MMTIDLRNNKYHQKTVILNRSKSIYIRYLFAHFIYTGAILPIGDEEAEDVKVTAKVLENIKKRRDNRGTTIVDVDDCGTAFRFCIALLSITQGDWLLTGSKKLLSRPFLPLVTSLKKSGASIMLVDHGILIKGKTIQAEQMEID